MNVKELRNYVENYENNLNEANELYKQYKEINYKLTSNYGQTFTGGDFRNSKIETYIMQKEQALAKIKKLETQIAIVNIAAVVLTAEEKAVIDKMKVWQNKTKIIASILNRDRKYVDKVRKRSLKKMCEYLNKMKK
jgi:maltooligosyltrehalose synthase